MPAASRYSLIIESIRSPAAGSFSALFLHSASCGDEAIGLSYSHGFLTAVASGPESLEASEWLRLMFDEPVFTSNTDGRQMLGLAMQLFGKIELGLHRETQFRPLFEYVRDGAGTVYPDAQPWSRGFSAEFALFSERWTPDARRAGSHLRKSL